MIRLLMNPGIFSCGIFFAVGRIIGTGRPVHLTAHKPRRNFVRALSNRRKRCYNTVSGFAWQVPTVLPERYAGILFVDRAPFTAKAGNGGNGCVSFHREKFVLNGGPDGGDGGHGGSIVLLADGNMHTLLDFRMKAKYWAQNGEDGRGGGAAPAKTARI